MHPETHTRLLTLLVLVAPCAAAYSARYLGAATAHASATVIDEIPELPVFPPESASSTEVQPTQRVASPFYYDENAPEQPVEIPAPTRLGTDEAPDPDFTLTAVMPSQIRPLAVINGRPRTIGDEIAPGWTITAIRGDDRAVVLTEASTARTRTIRMSSQPD